MVRARLTQVIVLVAGFGVPTASLRSLRSVLASRGMEATVAPTGLNLDCGERTAARLESTVAEAAAHAGAPVSIVGHSRGGQLARVVAVRRPELVSRLVTAGTPWTIGPPDRPGVAAVAAGVRLLRRAGLPVMGSIDCADGPCCSRFRVDLRAKPAARWTALWSSNDRIAGLDGAPPDEADDALDIGTSHLGFVLSGTGRDAIAAALA